MRVFLSEEVWKREALDAFSCERNKEFEAASLVCCFAILGESVVCLCTVHIGCPYSVGFGSWKSMDSLAYWKVGAMTEVSFSYLFCQSALLVLHYAMSWSMPWWVLWFPSVALAAALVLVFIIAWVVDMVVS